MEEEEWTIATKKKEEDIMEVVERFFRKDPVDGDSNNTGSYNKHYIYGIFDEEKVRRYKEGRIRFYRDFCEGGGNVKDLIEVIIGTWEAWDNYALALCFLILFNGVWKEEEKEKEKEKEGYKKIRDFMENIVFYTPPDNTISLPSLDKTRSQLYDLFY